MGKVGAVSTGAEKTKRCLGSGGKREWRSRREREVEGGRHSERVGSLVAVFESLDRRPGSSGHPIYIAEDANVYNALVACSM